MDLPDCPPGAEGYQDSVIGQVPKKPSAEDTCTKAEQEFQEHLNSLKIKLEDGETRSMVERRGRDVSGKWIYLCYPCAAVCSGESILQTHISGKKHKTKLSLKSIWPRSIFEEHPFIAGTSKKDTGATDKVLQKMAEEVDLHNKNPSELDVKYNKYRTVRCHIQDSIDNIKAPMLGTEYLVEHPPEQSHYEPSYMCTLCNKQGHPRTIVNHMTCFWHRYNYLVRHFPKASNLLSPFRGQTKYREGVSVIMNRLAQRIEDKYGRMQPVNIDKEEYEKDKERIHHWIFKSFHYSEQQGPTFEEVVDVDLITTLNKSNEATQINLAKKEPSPPVVAAPSKPHFNSFTQRSAGRQERRAGSADALSDISDDIGPRRFQRDDRALHRNRHDLRYDPYANDRAANKRREEVSNARRAPDRAKPDNIPVPAEPPRWEKKAPNMEYKLKLADERRKAAEDASKKTLAYHEKNPEKHPLYPEEWKKFWNRRYKEIQTEGKDPAKHDFKPEWIVFWTGRMKELHEEELRLNLLEIYRKLSLPLPDMSRRSPKRKSPERRRSPDRVRRPEKVEPRRRSPDRHDLKRRSTERPDSRRRLPERLEPRRRSPERSDLRRQSPDRRRELDSRRLRSPEVRREHRSPLRRSPGRRHSPVMPRPKRTRSRSPLHRARSPPRTHITLESVRRSRSPLSRRDEASRNRSPLSGREQASRNRSPLPAPSLQTVMISDDELKPDDGLSPWNSDDLDSLGSLPEARSPVRSVRSRNSSMSHASRPRRDYPSRGTDPQDLGPAENVVATLRLLVALEDYLGSLGPKIVDLLTEALKMEKDSANSSEELLDRESAVVLIETAKEKLKGAVQAGLVPHNAAAAVRAAVVRAAATLHAADTRAKRKQQQTSKKPASTIGSGMPVAGVGEVDRAQIAEQMAAALIAQGKTDVSSEELAQLVDAVVGMAEAKKRETEIKKKVEARAVVDKASRPAPPPPPSVSAASGTASALQMLQSAYDENDKKAEKEDAPDAMDGLSDSDLETLLKNFNELSAEEQHSLIAYLKKLEAKEPQRVERLRQYVSAAASSAPPQEEPPPKKVEEVKLVTIESDDDDDYTVEEVFQSVTQKVKEDQIRQEMEIVKKSLEEIKATPPKQPSPEPVTTVELTKSISSASDIFALVQASIQSTSAVNPPASQQTAGVVSSTTQPRSFGDLPEAPRTNANLDAIKPLLQTLTSNPKPLLQTPYGNSGMGFAQFGGNKNFQQESYNPTVWESNVRPLMSNLPDNRGSLLGNMPDRGSLLGNAPDNRGPLLNKQDNRGPLLSNMQENRGPLLNMQDNRGQLQNNMQDNRGPLQNNMQDNRGPLLNNMQDNRGPLLNNMQDNRGPLLNNMQDNRGPLLNNMPDNRGPLLNMQDHRGPLQNNMQDNRGPLQNNMQDNRGPLQNMQDNRGPLQNNMQDNRGPLQNNMQDNRGPLQNNMHDNRGQLMNNMQDNRGPLLNNMQDNRGPMGPPHMQRQGGYDNNFGQDSYNQGPRGNFNNRQNDMNQQFGNSNQGNNFRGRGRGNYGGGGQMRGRGRGYY